MLLPVLFLGKLLEGVSIQAPPTPDPVQGRGRWEWEQRQEKLQKETNFVMASSPHSSWTQLG